MAFIMVWLGFWTFACLSLLENVRRGWRDAVRPGIGAVSRVLAIVLALLVTAFSLPFLAGELFGLFALTQITSAWSAPLLLVLGSVSWLFGYLLKQPTQAGQLVMDQIDGFRMYLATAEGDGLRQAPPRTPELFEAMLPYAIALASSTSGASASPTSWKPPPRAATAPRSDRAGTPAIRGTRSAPTGSPRWSARPCRAPSPPRRSPRLEQRQQRRRQLRRRRRRWWRRRLVGAS